MGMTPNQLVEAVAACTGLSKETVVQHDRNLVVAGLRTKGGRGSSAAKVTYQDGARLLTAALGSLRVKDSVDTVKEHEATALDLVRCEFNLTDAPIPPVASLSADHNFVEALTAIIGAAAEDIAGVSAISKTPGWWLPIHVVVSYPWTAAEIIFFDDDPEYSEGKVTCRLSYQPSVSRKQIPLRSRDNLEAYKAWWEAESAAREREDFFQPHFDVICIEQKRRVKGLSIEVLASAFRHDGLPVDTSA